VNDPVYDVVMAIHVLAGIVGFGALGSTGAYAAAIRRAADPISSAAIRRYFTPGRNWAARAIMLVPILGGVMLALNRGDDARSAWPWIGLALWALAVALASAVIWPGERLVQAAFAAPEGTDGFRQELTATAARIERAAALTSLLFVAAFVVMIWQPV
jgi:uncharacterized membrane protein